MSDMHASEPRNERTIRRLGSGGKGNGNGNRNGHGNDDGSGEYARAFLHSVGQRDSDLPFFWFVG